LLGFLIACTYYITELQAQSIAVVSDEFAEAYTNPWLGAGIAFFLEEGEVIDIEAQEDGWITFTHEGETVYIPLSSVAIIQAEGLISANGAFLLTEPTPFSAVSASVPMGSILNVIGYYGDYYAIDLGGQSAYIYKTDILGGLLEHLQEYGPTPFVVYLDVEHEANALTMRTHDYLTVVGSTNGLNMRTLPNASSSIIKSIPNGNKLEVIEMGSDWHYVTYHGESGYVSSRFTYFNGESNSAQDAQEAVPAQNSLSAQIISNAKQYLGANYRWGGTSANTGFDCSGFVYTVYKSVGITLNRSSRDQIKNGTIIARSELKPGDLVFFATSGGSRISHVGIYIGNDEFIHSSSSNRRGVVISSLSESYYNRTYVNACRVIS